MRITFACAFIEVFASYDNANHASYLLNFFPARYKACSGKWYVEVQPTFHKNIFRKITQNKVCICQKFCLHASKSFLLWVLVFRKARCLPLLVISVCFVRGEANFSLKYLKVQVYEIFSYSLFI